MKTSITNKKIKKIGENLVIGLYEETDTELILRLMDINTKTKETRLSHKCNMVCVQLQRKEM